ncbi:MAG: hypothetical protein Kow006_21840 [Gammaproteobacteria bacterium]
MTATVKRPLCLASTVLAFLFAWTGVVLFQGIVFGGVDRLHMAILILVGGWGGLLYTARRALLLRWPISTLSLMGYTVFYFLLPPIATMAEWKPLDFNLEYSVLVASHALMGLAALLVAHWFYRQLKVTRVLRRLVVDRVYAPLGFHRAPAERQLWLMGFIGVASQLFTASVFRVYMDDAIGGVVASLLRGMHPLAYVPYALLIPVLWSQEKITGLRRHLFYLLLYSGPILIAGMARNSRTALMIGAASILMAYVYAVMAGLISRPRVTWRNLAVVLIIGYVGTGLLADLSTGFLIARHGRYETDTVTQIGTTLAVLRDKERLRSYRGSSVVWQNEWDEYYLENPIFSRVSNLKLLDQTLSLESRLDNQGRSFYRWAEGQKLLSVFPRPLLALIPLEVDKEAATRGSGGDFLLLAATGSSTALGTHRTGSLLTAYYVVFGEAYPIFLALTVLLLFPLLDALVKIRENGKSPDCRPFFNVLVIGTLFSYLFLLTSAATGVESVSGLAGYLIRGWLQIAVVYALAYWATRWVLSCSKLIRSGVVH